MHLTDFHQPQSHPTLLRGLVRVRQESPSFFFPTKMLDAQSLRQALSPFSSPRKRTMSTKSAFQSQNETLVVLSLFLSLSLSLSLFFYFSLSLYLLLFFSLSLILSFSISLSRSLFSEANIFLVRVQREFLAIVWRDRISWVGDTDNSNSCCFSGYHKNEE